MAATSVTNGDAPDSNPLRDQTSEPDLDRQPTTVNEDRLRSANGERTLKSILATTGDLPAGHALQVLLRVCAALKSVRNPGAHYSNLTPEHIIIDFDGQVSLREPKSRSGSNADVDFVRALAELFCTMVIGKVPSSQCEYDQLDARLSSRLRKIIHRATWQQPNTPYALGDFVNDLRWAERIQFWEAFFALIVFFAVFLYVVQH
ncbi:MAG TPA: hypothetical protein VKX49_24495 [Bryobacteraceae bacterium]|nr:hypothetical protein [Bryobacteraceae bacterium]